MKLGGRKLGLFSKIFKRRKELVEDNEELLLENVVLKRTDIQMANEFQRLKFVRNCLEQLNEASNELEKVTFEYNLVTSYLKDMEEIEALPEPERKKIDECADKIVKIDKSRKVYVVGKSRITDRQFNNMELLEGEMPEAYEKLKKCEIYQLKIKQDLKRIEGEKHAFYFRKEELEVSMANMKGMTIICGGAVLACLFLLIILNVVFMLQTSIGFMITLLVAAITITILFLKFREFSVEYKNVSSNINKIILLQNTVKIRYINNTRLLDYLRVKFHVSHAKELKILWKKYQEEKKIREKFERAVEDLDFYRKLLLKILSNYNIHDTSVWIYQVEALVDEREMVEIRHRLVVRRQSLRKQMEANKEMAVMAQNEIKELVEKHPEYGEEILSYVSEFEQLQRGPIL